jgi:ketosteroid isomerase-like protein
MHADMSPVSLAHTERIPNPYSKTISLTNQKDPIMKTLTHKIKINAPADKTWYTMFSEETFGKWTDAFMPGSRFEGSWKQGSDIKFLGPHGGGMHSRIAECRYLDHVSVEHLKTEEVCENGGPSKITEYEQSFYEKYTFDTEEGATLLTVEMDVDDPWGDMLDQKWPIALGKLKKLCEDEQSQDTKTVIQSLLKTWEDALAEKNVDELMQIYGDNVLVYDVGSQTETKADYRKLWEQCFPYFGDSIGVQRKDVACHIGADMALVTGYSRLTGMASDGDMAKSWFRMTIVFQKKDCNWKSIHEHISLPINCMEDKPVYILD